jgi:hypothetical protein
MLGLDLPGRLVLLPLPLECRQLRLGQNQPLLGHPLLQGRQPVLERRQPMALPDAPHAGGRDQEVPFAQLVAHPHLAQGRLLQGQSHDRFLDLRRGPIPQVRLPAGLLEQRLDAALLNRLLVAIEGVAREAHDLAGLRHVAELLGQPQQADLVLDDFWVCTHLGVPFWSTPLRLWWSQPG